MGGSYDPLRTEIHRKGVENIVNEMALTLVRTSGSPVVTHAKDFSTCLLDEAGEQLALSCYVLLHSASAWLNTQAVTRQLERVGTVPSPGDGWIVNDPYLCGSQHQGDVAIVMPTFYRREHVGWAFSNLHVLDIGGMSVSGVAPAATNVYEEALRFPALRIIREGQLDDEWKRYIAENVRMPVPVLNDIRSMIAANNVAQSKLESLIDRFGLARHREYNERNKELTERLLRRRIEAMPDGCYEAVEYVEFDGRGQDELIELRCTLTVAGSELRLEFAGDAQVNAPVNGTRGAVFGHVMTHVLTMLAYGDLPFNAGMWRPLTIDVGDPGTIVNARFPAPVSMAHTEPTIRCGKAARNVFTQAAALSSDPVLRARVGGIASDAYAALHLHGHDEEGAPSLLAYMDAVVGAGGGAQTVADGQDIYGSSTMAGSGMPDVEAHEASDPVLFLWRRIAKNSGGPGQLRGGQSLDEAFLLVGRSAFAGNTTGSGAEFPPPGFGGGLPPSASQQYPIRSTRLQGALPWEDGLPLDETSLGGTREIIGTRVGNFLLRPGDVVRSIAGGGAGLGDPLFRAPQLVAADVRDGYLTPEHAQVAYGVIVDADGDMEADETDRRRCEMRRARIGKRPDRAAVPAEAPGLSVLVRELPDGRWWTCAHCAFPIAPVATDWRQHLVEDELPIAELYERLGMRVRGRKAPPYISVRRYYCTSCGSCVSASVLTERTTPASPMLAGDVAVRDVTGG